MNSPSAFYEEPARRLPVIAECDVLVIGGGPGGIGAAVAAARNGAKTILVERFGGFGGTWTAGLLSAMCIYVQSLTEGAIRNDDVQSTMYRVQSME